MSQEEIQSAADLTGFVKDLLDQMNKRFETMTTSIVQRIDEMKNRIDDLESTVNKLVDESNQNQNTNQIPQNLNNQTQ